MIERFRAEKNRRGLLDYQDLIDKTLELLNNVSAAWVHYKLDRGIHHLLIDEAQDTSPKQWAIIKALTGEFFTGLGAHDRPRTVFAVGDEKQSIFSFQGAVPTEFANNRDHFARAHRDAEMKFVFAEFKHSFRSGPNVLEAVDAVFKPEAARAGLTAGGDAPVHEALPGAVPGLVEIWELEKSDEVEAKKGWAAPLDKQTITSGTVRLARRIAGSVAVWRAQGRLARDVLILVRRRGALFEAIIRALKNHGIPVAGADRLMLTEHIAVMDLMTLADALLLPEDDLALATVLKSPLFGLTTTICSSSPGTGRAACSPRCARSGPMSPRSWNASAMRHAAKRRSPSMRDCSARAAFAEKFSRGSVTKRPTRSTNSSISRSTTSAAKRRRCKVSWPGCAMRRPR